MIANYRPDEIDWQVKDTAFMQNLRHKETENEDLMVESFKMCMNGFANNYCTHYNSQHFKALFERKIETLKELKESLADQARSVNSIQEESKGLQSQIAAKLTEVRSADE